MDRPLLILSLITAILLFPCCSSGEPKTVRAAEDGTIRLGKIKEERGAVRLRVLVANGTGEKTTIKKFSTDCRCTTLKPSVSSAGNGEDFVIDLIFDPAYRVGKVREGFHLWLANGVIKDFALEANVVPCPHPMDEEFRYALSGGLWLSHIRIPFGKMEAGQDGELVIGIGNGSGRKTTVDLAPEGPYAGSVSLRRPLRLKNGGRDTLSVRFTMPSDIQPGDTLWIPVQPYMDGKATEEKLYVYSSAL